LVVLGVVVGGVGLWLMVRGGSIVTGAVMVLCWLMVLLVGSVRSGVG
jgi:hypothetical protein